MTSSRPTPETDAHDKEHCGLVLPEFARQLKRERDELREDAERYRFVRENPRTIMERWEAIFLEPHEWNAAIDAAIDAAKKPR